MIRSTSLEAYRGVKLNKNQRVVYEAVQDIYPCSDKDIAKYLNWPINSVTPRRGELFKKEKITDAYIAKDQTGRKVTFWKPSNVRQPSLFEDIA